MPSTNSFNLILPALPAKSKQPWHLRPVMLILVPDPHIPKFCTPGTLEEAIIVMVRNHPLLLLPACELTVLLAALTMYQRSRKLRDVIVDATSFISLAEDQL